MKEFLTSYMEIVQNNFDLVGQVSGFTVHSEIIGLSSNERSSSSNSIGSLGSETSIFGTDGGQTARTVCSQQIYWTGEAR